MDTDYLTLLFYPFVEVGTATLTFSEHSEKYQYLCIQIYHFYIYKT
jgi:hypothetical protein